MRVYCNPLTLENEWEDYGIGDPFILRFNGMYYLYCSTKDKRIGIKAWSSHDLIKWTYLGLVTEEKLTETAYAPEVVYWNGFFYMYTSPGGNGHYVLKSKFPEGPFEVKTSNLGMTIDGSVFIDDDAQWYFTHAGFDGIVGRKMISPFEFQSEKVLKAFLGHWTEGSMIIKRGDKYFLTYTGNHVFSDGYRVHYAISDKPLGEYKEPANNPILISVDKDYRGLGHSATVLGPDLDSYYITYHNLIGKSNEGPPIRKLNIDRLLFNNEIMEINRSINKEQPVPKQPDFYSFSSDDNNWILEENQEIQWVLSKRKTEKNYIAEFNFSLERDTGLHCSIIFDYVDFTHYYQLIFDKEQKRCILKTMTQGNSQVIIENDLPPGIDFHYLHTLRIEKEKTCLKIYIDNLLLIDTNSISRNSGGKIGYCYTLKNRPTIQYTAFSNDSFGSSDFDVYKVIPGSIEAVHYNKVNNESAIERLNQENFSLDKDNSHYITQKNHKNHLQYNINVSKTGQYGLDIEYKKAENAKLSLYVDDQKVDLIHVPNKNLNVFSKQFVTKIDLIAGLKILAIKLDTGSCEIKRIHLYPIEDNIPVVLNALEEEKVTTHGNWDIIPNKWSLATESLLDGKAFFGSSDWTDYCINTSFSIKNEKDISLGGVLVRVSDESTHEHQITDSFRGYYVSISNNKLQLFKINYNKILIDQMDIIISKNITHKLMIEVNKEKLKVFIDNIKDPIFVFSDPYAFMTGKIGIRSEDPSLIFNTVSLSS